jgi:hypothetical protein
VSADGRNHLAEVVGEAAECRVQLAGERRGLGVAGGRGRLGDVPVGDARGPSPLGAPVVGDEVAQGAREVVGGGVGIEHPLADREGLRA